MKMEQTQPSERLDLQVQLSKVTSVISSKVVSCSVQAHSPDLGTIVVTVSGMFSVMQRVFVVARRRNEEKDRYDWFLYCNGKKFTGAALSEVYTVIGREVQRTANVMMSMR